MFSPAINNDLRVNWSRSRSTSIQDLDDFGGATVPPDSLLFPFAPRESALLQFLINGGQSIIVGTGTENIQRQINIVDSLFIGLGAHQLKIGGDYRRLSPTNGPVTYQQQVNFSSGIGITGAGDAPAGSILSGRATRVRIFNSITRFPLFMNLSLFAQDTWKANRRLTLTYGLRWEYNPPPTERTGNDPFTLTDLDNIANAQLAPRGTPLYRAAYNNFAPRFGIAYQLGQKQGRETIFRGGFGVFYDLGNSMVGNLAGLSGFPYVSTRTLTNVLYPLVDPAQAAPLPISFNPPHGAIQVPDPNLKSPYTYQFSLAIEQSLGTAQTVTASYVGAVGRRLLVSSLSISNNPRFSAITVTRSVATSDYDALQFQFQRRLSKGLQALASYTWSRSVDSASADSTTGLDLSLGPSDFDIRHVLSSAITYNIPRPRVRGLPGALLRNWSFDTIVAARSASPVNIISGFENIDGVSIIIRPNLITDVPFYLNDPTAPGGRVFNDAVPTAAQIAAAGCAPQSASTPAKARSALH